MHVQCHLPTAVSPLSPSCPSVPPSRVAADPHHHTNHTNHTNPSQVNSALTQRHCDAQPPNKPHTDIYHGTTTNNTVEQHHMICANQQQHQHQQQTLSTNTCRHRRHTPHSPSHRPICLTPSRVTIGIHVCLFFYLVFSSSHPPPNHALCNLLTRGG